MGRPNRDGRNALQETMERLVPVAATARGRHWCSQEARPKAGSEVTYRSVSQSLLDFLVELEPTRDPSPMQSDTRSFIRPCVSYPFVMQSKRAGIVEFGRLRLMNGIQVHLPVRRLSLDCHAAPALLKLMFPAAENRVKWGGCLSTVTTIGCGTRSINLHISHADC